MSFLCKQISDNRWGIYDGPRLLATVSDRATCEAIMANFRNIRRAIPTAFTRLKTGSDAVETSVVAKNAIQSAAVNGESAVGKTASQRTSMMSDEELARVLNLKSLKVRELESAVLRAQRNQEE